MPYISELELKLKVIWSELVDKLPYDYEANEVIANAVRDFLREHTEYVQEFEEIVLTYDEKKHGKLSDPDPDPNE